MLFQVGNGQEKFRTNLTTIFGNPGKVVDGGEVANVWDGGSVVRFDRRQWRRYFDTVTKKFHTIVVVCN